MSQVHEELAKVYSVERLERLINSHQSSLTIFELQLARSTTPENKQNYIRELKYINDQIYNLRSALYLKKYS